MAAKKCKMIFPNIYIGSKMEPLIQHQKITRVEDRKNKRITARNFKMEGKQQQKVMRKKIWE